RCGHYKLAFQSGSNLVSTSNRVHKRLKSTGATTQRHRPGGWGLTTNSLVARTYLDRGGQNSQNPQRLRLRSKIPELSLLQTLMIEFRRMPRRKTPIAFVPDRNDATRRVLMCQACPCTEFNIEHKPMARQRRTRTAHHRRVIARCV